MKKLFYLFMFIGFYSFGQSEASDSNIKQKINVNNNKIIIVDFYADWCGPCRSMDPILKEIAKEYASKVEIYKINVDKNNFGNEHNVTSIPTYLFYQNGKQVKRAEGAIGKSGMVNIINSISNGSNNTTDNNSNNNTTDQLSDANLRSIWNDHNALNNVAWKAYENETNPARINKAISAIERSIQLNSNYYNLDTYAALLYKSGRNVEALKQCKKAIQAAKNTGNDYTETNELILKIIDKL